MLGPKMGLNQQPGRIANAEIEIDEKETATALNRAAYQPSYARNSNAYIGGQSAQQEEQQAYARTAEHTLPGATRQEQAANERLRQEARDMPNPERPAFIAGEPQRGRGQAQQHQQAEQQHQPQAQQAEQGEQGEQAEKKSRKTKIKHETPNRAQQDTLARFTGRMVAAHDEGIAVFEERKPFDNQQSLDVARQSFSEAKGQFRQMAEYAREAAGNKGQQQGQSKQAEAEPVGGRFTQIAALSRSDSSSQQTQKSQSQGAEI